MLMLTLMLTMDIMDMPAIRDMDMLTTATKDHTDMQDTVATTGDRNYTDKSNHS